VSAPPWEIYWARVAFAVLAAMGLGLGARRVIDLERRELDLRGESTPLVGTVAVEDGRTPTPHQELGRVAVAPGESLLVEVCSEGSFPRDRWLPAGVTFVLWQPERHEVAHQARLDAAALEGARRSPAGGACVTVARGRGIQDGGTYALEAIWDVEGGSHPPDEPVQARFAVHRGGPGIPGLFAWGACLLGIFGVVALPWRGPGPAVPEEDRPPESSFRRPRGVALPGLPLVFLGVGLFLVAMGAVAWLPIGGAAGSLARGVGLGAAGAVLALGLGGRWIARAFPRPSWLLSLGLSPLVGLGLYATSRLATMLVPAGGQAPIEATIAWPSGMLAVALVSVLVPAAEELFFRGFLFGALEDTGGKAVAVVGTTVLFAAAHLPQTHGAWGAVAAIAVTGLVLGALRAATGALLPCIVAHLAHNALLSGSGLAFAA